MSKCYKRSIIATTLCISEKRVKQLTEEGVLVEVITGHYGLIESVQAYIKYLQNKISDRDTTSDYNVEKAKLTRAKREKEEAELAHKKGDLHKSSDVEFVVGNMITSFRAKALTIPNKSLPKIKNAKDDKEILAILKSELIEALDEMSEYDNQLFLDNDGDNLW